MAFKPDQAEKNFRKRIAAENLERKINDAYQRGIADGRMQILKENVIRAAALAETLKVPSFLK